MSLVHYFPPQFRELRGVKLHPFCRKEVYSTSQKQIHNTFVVAQNVVDAVQHVLLFMMIDMHGPDIEAVDEVETLILESVNTWKKLNFFGLNTNRGRATVVWIRIVDVSLRAFLMKASIGWDGYT
jgi:hypothetical protein